MTLPGSRGTEGGQSPRRLRVFLAGLIGVAVVASFGAGYLAALAGVTPLRAGVTLVDDAGRIVTVPSDVKRVVTLAPSTTELAFSIGLGTRVVCVADLSDYPPEAADETRYPKIGTYPSVNLEALSACDPDLVLASGLQSKTDIEHMETTGFVVLVLDAKTLSGVLYDLRLLGLAVGLLEPATEVADALQTRIDAVAAKTSNTSLTPHYPTVYLEFFPYFTFGPGSFGNDLIRIAGGRNIASNTTVSFPQLSNEFIVAANPEFVVYTVGPYTQTTKEDILGRPGWEGIAAVTNDRIFTIDDSEVVRSGPRLVDALEDLARILHPDLFP